MNAENFKEFIENPSRLYQLSYQELKSLVLQYPYSANLHFLLLQKSAMENHRELNANRQKAATYSIDRTYLYHLIQKIASPETTEPVLQLDVEEEFLELKDLSILEKVPNAPLTEHEADETATDIPLPELETPPSGRPSEGTEEEINIDIDFDLEPLTSADEEPEEEQPAASQVDHSDIFEFVSPAKTGEEPDETTDISTEETPPAAYKTPAGILSAAATISSVTSRLKFTPSAPVAAPQPDAEPEPPAERLLHKKEALLHKLDDLLAKRTTASPTPPAAPKETITDRSPAATVRKKPTPQPKGSFTSWVRQFQPDEVKQQLGDLMEARKREEIKRLKKQKKKARKKKKKADVDQHIIDFAEQSLTDSQIIISETLAELLAEQGQTEMSINMYEKLKLVFPEKSTYFAAIIEKLKKE